MQHIDIAAGLGGVALCSPFEQVVYNTHVQPQHHSPTAAPKQKRALLQLLNLSCLRAQQSFTAAGQTKPAGLPPAPPPSTCQDASASVLAEVFSRGVQTKAAPGSVAVRQQRQLSYAYSDADWFDAVSVISGDYTTDTAAGVEQVLPPAPSQPNQHSQPAAPQNAPWIPDSPLLFADPGMAFIPVPKSTGFQGYWEVDESRTTPHPQPIDVMIKASYLVRKVHKSMAGMHIQEADGQLTITGQPTFVPLGLPSVYCEVYDKSNETDPSWTPRRDLRLGSCYGKVYMTVDGVLVLRVEARAAFTGKVEFITEDYLRLEEDGQVLVDRMCCFEVATKRTATQYQVARRRPHL